MISSPSVVGGRLHQVGDLGRVQPGQLAVGDAQPRRRDVGDERLDARPVDQARPTRHPRRRVPATAGGAPAGCCGSTPMTSQVPSTWASSISLARISRPPTMLMRWRASRSRASRSSPGRRSNRRRSTRFPVKRDPAGADVGDLADRNEQVPSPDAHDRSHHRRMGCAEADDQILHPPDPVARLVDERPLDHVGQVNDADTLVRRHHGRTVAQVHPDRTVRRTRGRPRRDRSCHRPIASAPWRDGPVGFAATGCW